MKFPVTRASLFLDDRTRPCAGAEQVGDEWVVEIDSLDGLLAFIKREGRVVIGEPYFNKGRLELTIYDDYIE